MKLDTTLRDISLRAIAFLVILITLWAIVLMVGVSFNWSFLTRKVESAFYLGGFTVGLLIFALSFMNISSSLTIISKAQNKEGTESKGVKKQFGIMLVVSLAFIVFVVGGLWFAEWQVYKKVSDEAWNKVQVIAEKKQFAELANKIKENGQIEDILAIRDALSYDVSSEGKVSFLFPKDRAGVKIYYEITPWLRKPDNVEFLSDADLNKFRPNKREKKEFDQLARGEIDSFKVPVRGNHLRVFLAKTIDGQEMIILLDTSRQLSDYRGSFK